MRCWGGYRTENGSRSICVMRSCICRFCEAIDTNIYGTARRIQQAASEAMGGVVSANVLSGDAIAD
jgi:hypothetical protein